MWLFPNGILLSHVISINLIELLLFHGIQFGKLCFKISIIFSWLSLLCHQVATSNPLSPERFSAQLFANQLTL